MSNIARVTSHARTRLIEAGCNEPTRRALTLVRTHEGANYHVDSAGEYWRAYLFIEGARGYDIVENEKHAYEAAKAFGEFQKLLADLPGERLNETIPDFHNTRKRFAAFEAALEKDALQRADNVKAEIDWVFAHKHLAGALLELHEQGTMPERITHNDTKLNNVLLDNETGEAICVIDLDTLMPGLALYDFGDLVRTCTSPVAEDEPDTAKVTMQMPMFKALANGYLAAAGTFLTETERNNLPLAGMVITFEIGLRFLTDYLQGDTYFKTKRIGHNLDRCRTQFALVDSMIKQKAEMQTATSVIWQHLTQDGMSFV
jgi:Ser/Thr protein kinase RdoA (MazF antagonist)